MFLAKLVFCWSGNGILWFSLLLHDSFLCDSSVSGSTAHSPMTGDLLLNLMISVQSSFPRNHWKLKTKISLLYKFSIHESIPFSKQATTDTTGKLFICNKYVFERDVCFFFFLLFSCVRIMVDGLTSSWGMPVWLVPSDKHVGSNGENSFSHVQESLPLVSACYQKCWTFLRRHDGVRVIFVHLTFPVCVLA